MKEIQFFDADFDELEQLPRKFTVRFESIDDDSRSKTRIFVNDVQIGDVIDDNSKENDSYRFHDVFHYTFATMLGWSPCTRAMMRRKRKSDPVVDHIEDGARAAITEESISLILFNKAKSANYFKHGKQISSSLLAQIKEMTASFEVAARSKEEWREAILKGYSLFRSLVRNNGGKINFDMHKQTASYLRPGRS
jgi:hypothetical protein